MKLIYLHGFGSSGASGTAELLRLHLPHATVVAPDIPVDPLAALPALRQLCADEQPDIVVGTSMGGMYAHQMHGFVRVCVNPALNMSTAGRALRTGTHKFFSRRRDNQKEFTVTRETIRHYNQVERAQFKDITPWDRENCYGLFGIDDTVARCYDLFRRHYPHAIRFEGEHRLNDKVVRRVLLPLVKQLLGDKCEDL